MNTRVGCYTVFQLLTGRSCLGPSSVYRMCHNNNNTHTYISKQHTLSHTLTDFLEPCIYRLLIVSLCFLCAFFTTVCFCHLNT